MRIVLDSNIFCSDYQLKGSNFKLLFDGLNLSGGSLYIPQIVIDEVVNKFQDELNACHGKMAKQLDRANVVSLMGLVNPLSPNSIIRATTDYRKELTHKIKQAGTVANYPEVPHEHVVRRDLRRAKPFSEGGQGYRDALIWENVLSLAQQVSEPVVFISSNRRDFCAGSGLHPDLVADLLAREIDPAQILYYEKLESFVAEHIKPVFEVVDLKEQLQAGRFGEIDIRGYIAESIPVLLDIMELEPEEVGFPPEFKRPSVASVRSVTVAEILDASRLPSGEVFASMVVKFDCDMTFEISGDDFPTINRPGLREAVDLYVTKEALQGSKSLVLELVVSMTFDEAKTELTSFDLDSIHVPPDQRLDSR